MTTRTIEFLYIDDDEITTAIKEVGTEQFFAAIGYLSMWGMQYPKVSITLHTLTTAPPEFVAVYKDERENIRFVMGAIFNSDTKEFSFHS